MHSLIISNSEIIQSTIEIMGAAFCIIAMLFLQLSKRTKFTKLVSLLFIINAFLLFFDAGAYIFRGNLSTFSLFMTRFCNFAVFSLQIFLSVEGIELTYILIEKSNIKVNKIYKKIGLALGMAAFSILFINIFTDFMYYFDNFNYYHRNFGFYIFSPLCISIIVLTIFIVFKYRKQIDKELVIGIILYELIPGIATLIQVFIYGIILTNFSLILSFIVILLINIRITERIGDGISEETRNARKTLNIVFMIFMLVVTLSLSLVINIRTIQNIAEQNKKENSETKFLVIRNGIEYELLKPILISDTLAQDTSLKNLLIESKKDPNKDISDGVSTVLNAIQNGFNYKTAFTVSEGNKNYYTNKGLSRNVDNDISFDDSWYNDFIDSEKIYELNIDKDKDNSFSLSVFINRRIFDENGELLGVCGLGVDLMTLSELIKVYENKYGVDISLVSEDGVIQIDSELDHIGKIFLDNSYFNEIRDGEIYYEIINGKERMTAFMEYFNWYLVINNNNKLESEVKKIVWPSILVFFIGALIMTGVFFIMFEREKTTHNALEKTKQISFTDKLTGIGNLRAYDKACETILINNKLQNYTVVMFDVNGLKFANDNIGHEAGDELIIGTAECCKKAFGQFGEIFRTGGDEFFALLNCSRGEIETAEMNFLQITSLWHGKKIDTLNVALGYIIAAENPDLSLDELERKAEELMYINKSNFYMTTGIERRKR